jgi:hypothetical protein
MIKLSRSFFVTALIVLLFTACSLTEQAGQAGFPTDLLLKQQDLPDGFTRKEYVTVSDIPDATEALAIGFVVPDGSQFPPIRVSQRLAVYIDETTAQKAYPDWEKGLFPVDDWKTPDDFHFKPADAGDLYRFGCMLGYFNGKDFIGCSYIQQHKNIISEVLANLDGTVLKLEDVEKTLANLDARMSQVK